MADNIFSIPGYNPLRFNPQMPLAQTKDNPNVQGPQFINPYEKQNQGVSPYTMHPSWQFGLNYNQIAFSSAVQGIGAFLRSNNQRKDFNSYNRVQQSPLSQIPENPNNTDQAMYGMKQFAEGGQFDNFDDFDEDDFEDLKGELDRYFNDKGQPQPEGAKEEDKEEPNEQKQPEPEEQDDQSSNEALNFLNQPQQDNQDDSQVNQSDEDIIAQLSGRQPIPHQEAPHPSVYSTKPTDDVTAFKKGIAAVENANYSEGNKNSSAFGKYQFTAPTRESVREQFFKDIKKEDFESAYKSDPQFQERVMDVYGNHLLQKYTDPHKAATAFFLGEGKVGMYNQPDYNPGNGNVSVGKYLSTFDKGYSKRQGGHIMNSPGSVTTGFDRPYNFKMEDGGDPQDPKKPVQTNRPTTADSVALYNNALQVANYYKNSGYTQGISKSPSLTDWNDQNTEAYNKFVGSNFKALTEIGYRNLNPEEYRKNIDNNVYYQREMANKVLDMRVPSSRFDRRIAPQFSSSLTKHTGSEFERSNVVDTYSYDPIAVKPWNMLTPDERQQRVTKYGYPITNHEEITKTTQPQYQPPIAKGSQIQGPQKLATDKVNIEAPTGGTGPLAGGPTNFSFTGRNDQGQQDTRYFSDLDTWKAATDQMGYRWRNETNNGKQANASGYQFKQGGEYHLTNLQIAQLKKQGYEIEIIK